VQDAAAPRRTDESSLRYRGWRVVLACFLMALFLFGFGLYGHGVYLAELQRLNGWPAALISGASTLSLVLCNMLAAFTNELVTRLGIKRLVLLGLLALAASVIMLAFATWPWQLYAALALMSLGWIGMGTVVIATVVSLWFERRRGLAISVAFTGASFGGVVVTPLLVFLIEQIGFAAAMSVMTALMVAVLVPIVLAWIAPPSSGGPEQVQILDPQRTPPVSADISRATLMRRLTFWTIAIPFALALVAQIGFIVHQIALLEPKIGRTHAGFAVSVMTFMAIAGRLGLGVVVDRFDPRLVTAASLASQAAALLIILATDSVPVVWAACALFGFSVGNIITLPPLIINREFSAASFTMVMGLSNAISGTVGSLGPALLGLVRGWSGDYHMALVLCIGLELVAAALVIERRLLVWRPASTESKG
jgi:MFS family permease